MTRKILFLLLLCIATATATYAQESAFAAAAAPYRTGHTATAKAVMTKHNKAMTKNTTYSGNLYMKSPDKVAIVCNGGKEQLVMNGNTFTMVMAGRKHVASAKTASQFAAFKAVLLGVLDGGKTNIAKVQGVTVTTKGGSVVVTMTPAKAKHMMFTSFVLAMNSKTGALESLTMNNKRGFTKYAFSNFKFGTAVAEKVFVP